MTDEWQDIPEDDGLTLGPEEALAREIAKSKALKVERLRLQDQVEQLTAHNQALRDENEALQQDRGRRSGESEISPGKAHHSSRSAPRPRGPSLPDRWVFFLLIFNLAAIGILLLFMLQKPAP